MKQIQTAKNKLIQKAKVSGIYENFGQKEVQALKAKLKYNPYGSPEERQVAAAIDRFDEWCINFDLSQLN